VPSVADEQRAALSDVAGVAWIVGHSLVSLTAEEDAPARLERTKDRGGFMMGVTTIRETQ
jgi:hypothetical protein